MAQSHKKKWLLGSFVAAVVLAITMAGQFLLGVFAVILALLTSWIGIVLLLIYTVFVWLIVRRVHVVRRHQAMKLRSFFLHDRQVRMYASLIIIASVVITLFLIL